MYQKVFNISLAQYLCRRGFQIIEVRPNPDKPWLNYFIFNRTRKLMWAIEDWRKENGFSQSR